MVYMKPLKDYLNRFPLNMEYNSYYQLDSMFLEDKLNNLVLKWRLLELWVY